ncbi:hypothetical protein [Inhella proteolytica]|uniref:Uncharacterized protein n=1 Tax=Inhella proteolytica TaxID=2795029 RepID=A0A931J0J6_9BURK|nr:hypothetical protein [Inhella proteolytica]MBH9577251.1 hypothetical protein [Inhella proteolytica]
MALLLALVSACAAIFFSGKDFWLVAIGGSMLTAPMAISAWHGDLFGKHGGPQTAGEWLLYFAMSSVLSAVFVAIDLAVVHPGLSLVFTLGALAMTFVALPGAARAWLLESLAAHQRDTRKDA